MSINKIIEQFKKHHKFLITAHNNPDGDSIGSQLSLRRMLVSLGKEVDIIGKDKIPDSYKFLSDVEYIRDIQGLSYEDYDCLVVVDSSNIERTCIGSHQFPKSKIINIDHHKDNTNFGEFNFVNANASSASEIVYKIFSQMDIPIDTVIAELIYTGIFTDTGGLRFSNSNPDSFDICGKMVSAGAKPDYINNALYNNNSLAKFKMRGKIHFDAKNMLNGKVCFLELDASMIEELGAKEEDVEGISDEALSVAGTEIGVFARYYPNKVKFNLRSKGKVNVGVIAKKLGGGGHPQASACSVEYSKEVAIKKLMSEIELVLSRISNN